MTSNTATLAPRLALAPRLSPALRVALALTLALALPPAAAAQGFRVLVFSKTVGFRHDSIPAGIALVHSLGAANGFAVEATEDSAQLTDANLDRFEAVIWLNTTGNVLANAQQAAFERYMRAGGGFVGVHSAADTEYVWPFYGTVLGGDAWFANHPAIQTATLVVEDSSHPSTAHLPPSFAFTDEWYNFQANPRPAVTVLARVDESSYDPGPGAMGDHPIAWCHRVDLGRAWYTNLGHRIETYSDPAFVPHLLGGIRWAAGNPIFLDGFESGNTSAWSETIP
jgi:type 1 glutamine amidotransferase